MKRLLSGILAAAMAAIVFTGCSAKPAPAASGDAQAPAAQPASDAGSEGKKLTLGVSMNSADEFRTSLFKAIESAATAKGYTVIQTNADFDPSKQISDVESLIQKKPDVIMIFAVDGEAAVAAVEAVKAAGIGCIAVDFPINTDSYDTFVADDQQLHGQLQAEYVLEWLEKDPSRKANVGYFIGAYMESALDRHDGFVEVCNSEANDRVTLLSEQCGNWMADDAMAITEDWIQKFPEMNVFVSMNDDMAIGCIQALKASGRNMDDVLILGIDGTENGIAAVRAGELDATTTVKIAGFADAVVETCEKVAAGEEVPQTVKPGMIQMVTTENIKEIMG